MHRSVRNDAERGEVVELVTSRDAERRIFEHAQHAARNEVVTLVRPPVRLTRLDTPFEQDQQPQRTARARGVRYRSIVDAGWLALPGAPSRVRSESESGEEIRVFPELPFKIAIFDRRIAFIPLESARAGRRDVAGALVGAARCALCAVRKLVGALDAARVLAGRRAEGRARHRACPRQPRKLIPLLAAGLNDKAIAHELDVSSATLNRRLAELMKGLDTRTRFQMGWRAALEAFPERTASRTRSK